MVIAYVLSTYYNYEQAYHIDVYIASSLGKKTDGKTGLFALLFLYIIPMCLIA